MASPRLAAALGAYVVAVVTANYATAQLGLVPVGFGLLVTAGTFAVGFALLARDVVQQAGGLAWALVAIALSGALSWAVASPGLALASTVALLGAELVDLAVFTPTRSAGFVRAALASNVVSAPIDTVLFLVLAGFPLTWHAVAGQFVGKVLWATVLPLAIYLGVRRVRYFANPSTDAVRAAMTDGRLSMIATPKQRQAVPADATWCADNGCFGKGYPGDAVWFGWLAAYAPTDRARCMFATAPDVVGDAAATLARSLPWLARIRELGYPAALVAQDGLESLEVPWDEFDVLFIGGTTEWKLGAAARRLVTEAKAHGKHVHMGRVNSLKRLRYADAIGCASADGTYIAFAPDANLPRMLSNLRVVNEQEALT